MSLTNLSNQLSSVGREEHAVAAKQEAKAINGEFERESSHHHGLARDRVKDHAKIHISVPCSGGHYITVQRAQKRHNP
jgi:hypothetical protein